MTIEASAAPRDVAARPGGHLLKVLGPVFGLAVLVGNAIGMGILRTPGEIAARVPSVPLFIAVWIAGAAYALLGALTLAELAAMRPRSGGLSPLVGGVLGRYPGFVVGWTDWLATSGSMAAVAIVLGEYSAPLLPVLAGSEKMVAIMVILAFTVLQWRGVRIGDRTQQLTSLLKGLGLVVLALVALVMGMVRSTDVAPPATPAVVPSGFALAAAMVVALQSAIYTYDGWSGPVYFGEELRDPGRDIPRTMIGGVLLIMAIYLLLNAAFLVVVPIAQIAGDPFVAATVARRLFGTAGDMVLRVAVVVSLLASVNALLLMASRIPYAMSRDAPLPAALGRANRGGTPLPALPASSALGIVMVATNTFERVIAMLAFLFVANYALTFLAWFVRRRREPDAARPFRTPLQPLVPALALLGSLAFIGVAVAGDTRNSLVALALVLASWPAYRLLRRARADPR